jgi:hypothetical protein
MSQEAVQSLSRVQSLLDRATYVHRQKSGHKGDAGEVIVDALKTYHRVGGARYGVPDELSTAVVYGAPQGIPPAHDLDEVARRLTRGRSPSAGLDRPVPQAPVPDDAADQILARAQAMGLNIDETEAALVREVCALFAHKNGRTCTLTALLADSLRSYLKEYEPSFGPEDPISRTLVNGFQEVCEPVDLDEAARRAVRVGRCYRRGDCCRRTIGVAVTEKDVERVEKTGRRRADFLDEEEMRLKVGPGGCFFLTTGLDGTPACQIYAHRPTICRNYFCNRGPK